MSDYRSRTEKRQAMNTKNTKGNYPTGGKKSKSLFKRIMLVLTLLFLFLMLAGSITVFAIIKNAPPLNPAALKDPISSQLYDKNGHQYSTVFQKEQRIYVNINKIPNTVQEAFISTEDARFYKHFGIDPYRIGGALVANLTHGFGSQGASTITQQVIKNSYLSPKKTITRKIQEAYLAIKLEQKYTKKQILQMYLNKIYLGQQAYGVGTASKVYFGKKVQDLSLAQSAMLAALPQAPSYYDPLANPKAAKQRRDLVLDLMVKNHAISKAQADKAKQVPMKTMLKNHQPLQSTHSKYDAFVNYVFHDLVDVKHVLTKDEFYNGGLKIYTTIDPKAQTTLENTLNNNANFPGVQKNFQAASTIVDTQTGAIRAIGGGRNFQYGNLNWAISTENQIGSTAKPIMDYGPAVNDLQWSTGHITDDSPFSYPGGGGQVHNWDHHYFGKISIREALAASRNIPAIKTMLNVQKNAGQSKVKDFANNLGFNFKNVYPSYAIGSFTASPLQMAGAYAAFGNQGVYNQPFAVTKIVKPDGSTINLNHEQHAAMHDYTAYMVTDMLKSVVNNASYGTGTAANIPGVPLAGKTGTQGISDAYANAHNIPKSERDSGATDAWFVGYTPKLTMSIWTGYVGPYGKNTGSYLTHAQQHLGLPVFKSVMSSLASTNTPDWKKPNDVVSVKVEKGTGLLPSPGTPSDQVTQELFVKGHEPTKVSTKYKQEKLPTPSKLQAKYDAKSKALTVKWSYDPKYKATFDISGDGVSQSSSSPSVTIQNVQPGKKYSINIIAKPSDKKYKPSDPANINVQIPKDNQNSGNGNGGNPPGKSKTGTGTTGNPGNTNGTNNTPPSSGSGNTPPSSGSGNTPPSSGSGNTPPSSGSGNTPPSSGSGNTPPSSGSGNTPSSGG